MGLHRMLNKMFVGFAALLVAVGCAKSDNNSRSARVSGTGAGVAANAPACANNPWGRIYDDGSGGFQNNVYGLLSATLDPTQNFGTIDGSPNSTTTGVAFKGHLAADASGNIIPASTNIAIVISDSKVGTQDANGNVVQPYQVTFNSADSGKISGNTFTVKFKDSYGEINLQGSFDQTYVGGTITYQNYVSATGETPAAGSLGNFAINRCAFIY